MNNFVKGLVRRSAGLPSVLAVRPAIGVAGLPPAENTAEGPAIECAVPGKESLDGMSPEPEQARPSVAASTPIVSETRLSVENRPPSQQEPSSVQPRVEPFRPHVPTDGPTARAVVEPATLPAIEEHNMQPPVWQPSSPPANAPIEPRMGPDLVPKHASPELLEAVDSARDSSQLLPRPEPPPTHGPADSLPMVTASSGQANAPETRNIKVSIGKVEIRSNQPANVVQVPRPSRTSGFDDLRLARTYLDRSAR
jgi:hypothetical protein